MTFLGPMYVSFTPPSISLYLFLSVFFGSLGFHVYLTHFVWD
jgi:hypothetical protein